jgi:hypothetical protein
MKVRFWHPLGNDREIARPSPSNCKLPAPQTGFALAGRWERAVPSAILRVVSRPTTGAPCTFQSSILRNVLRTAIRGFPKHPLFSAGLTPERDSSSAWYTARETWNVCHRFIRARGPHLPGGHGFGGWPTLLIISIPGVPRRSSNGGKGPVPELYLSMASALPNLP